MIFDGIDNIIQQIPKTTDRTLSKWFKSSIPLWIVEAYLNSWWRYH